MSTLSVSMAIFPGEPGLAGSIEAKDDGIGGDNWSYKTSKVSVISSTPTNQHPMFYRPDVLHVAQPTVSVNKINLLICSTALTYIECGN